MAEPIDTPATSQPEGSDIPVSPEVAPVATDAPEAVPMAQYRELEARLAELQDEREAATERLTALEAEAAQRLAAENEAKRKAAEEQGQFQELYAEEQAKAAALRDELEAKTSRLTVLEQQEQERIDARKAANADRFGKLPEAIRALAVDGLDANPDQMAAWLDRAEAMPEAKVAVGGGERRADPRTSPTTLTPQQAETAKALGFDPKTESVHFLTNIWPAYSGKAAPEA